MTTTIPFMIKGQSLVDYVAEKMPLIERGELTRTDMIKDAGYIYDNGKAMYVDFYTELLNARGVIPATSTDVEDKEYADLDQDKKELYDSVDDKLGRQWSHSEIIEFLDELEDIGITTARDFEDAYEYEHDGYEYNAEATFAEYFVCEVLNEAPSDTIYAAVDWQAVWDHNLRYDYCYINTSNGTYFFRNN